MEMKESRQLKELADKAHSDLGWIAPEDVDMRKTKIFLRMVEAFNLGRKSAEKDPL